MRSALWQSALVSYMIKYFQGTDTLHIEFRSVQVAETRDLDENTLLDLDQEGKLNTLATAQKSQRFLSSRYLHNHDAVDNRRASVPVM